MVVGLGNPGVEYEASRHNVGFLVVEALARRAGVVLTRRRHRSLFARGVLQGEEVLLVKPLTFVNDSGSAVSAWQQVLRLAPTCIVVVHDDLDLPISIVRIKAGGGHGGHNGVRSILEALGNGDFLRVKVGIGRPRPGHDAVTHVLGPFQNAEQDEIERAVERAADAVEVLLRDGVQAVWTERQRGVIAVNSYEVIFILDPAITEDGVEAEIGAVREVVAKKGGEVTEVQKWGKKRLAYEIKKRRDGQYVLVKVFSPAGVVADLERHFRITETVLKGVAFKAEDPRKARFKAKAHRSREGVASVVQEVGDG